MKLCMLAPIVVLAAAGAAQAVVTTLEDRNSTTTIQDASTAGMNSWQVDGVNQMFQQWFWFRYAGDASERGINTLALTGSAVSDTNPFVDNRPDRLRLQYTDAGTGLQIAPSWTLRGGTAGSGNAGVNEEIRITNNGQTRIQLSFFQYSDFDINGTAGGDSVVITGGNTAEQFDGVYGSAETVVTPAPFAYQAGNWPSIINSLTDGAVTNLNNNAGPVLGDCSWAFQWEFDIAPGDSVLISKVKNITPAPGALALLGLGGLIAGRRRR